MNKLKIVLIFAYLCNSNDDPYVSSDYFSETMCMYIGTDVDKDGNVVTYDKWNSYETSDDGLFEFIELIGIDNINNNNMIREYTIDGKIEYRINGIHQLLVNFIVEDIPRFFKIKKDMVREYRLGQILDN